MKRSERASNFAFAKALTNGSTSALVLALALGLTMAIAIVIAAIIHTNLNMALMSPLTISDPLRPAEVIAVLSGGYNSGGSLGSATVERMDRGIELYRRGHAPVMILSGGDKPPSAKAGDATGNDQGGNKDNNKGNNSSGRPEAEAMAGYARRCGVPAGAVVIEGRSLSTAQNTANIAAIARTRGWRTVILVTSPYHARRAGWMLRDQGLEVISAPAVRSEAYSAVGRHRLRIFRLIALEYLKLARYLIFRT